MSETRVKWAGGARLLNDGATRLGNLYLMDGALWFVEGGKVRPQKLGGAGNLLAMAGVVSVIPLSIEGYARMWTSAKGWAPLLAQLASGLAVVALIVMAVKVALGAKQKAEDELKRLCDDSDLPEADVIAHMTDALPGSFSLPLTDIVTLERLGEHELLVIDKVDERYELRAVPDRKSFVEALEREGRAVAG
jgi:hypothetical protein